MPNIEDIGKQNDQSKSEADRTTPYMEEPTYPDSVQKMSEKWRSIQKQGSVPDQRSFFDRNFIILGIGIALLIVALLIVIGGFAFLVWNAR